MLAVKMPNNNITVQLTKVKDKKGNEMGEFNIDLFMWKEKYKEWVEKAKHLEEGNKKLYSLFDEEMIFRDEDTSLRIKWFQDYQVRARGHQDIQYYSRDHVRVPTAPTEYVGHG